MAHYLLGLKGFDKIVDDHFEKIPDKAFDPQTYKIRKLRRRGKNQNRNSSPSSSSSDSEEDMPQDPRLGARNASPPEIQRPPISSREPRHTRPQYIPSPPPSTHAYYPSPPNATVRRSRTLDRDYDYAAYSASYRGPPRPKAVSRRSSSYDGPRDRGSYGAAGLDDRRLQYRERRSYSGSRATERMKDASRRYDLEGELGNVFTKSKAGLAGGALGAVVGGWVVQQAHHAVGREKKGMSNTALTLLGAAVGGLVANAAVDQWEEAHGETAENQGESDKKSGKRGGAQD